MGEIPELLETKVAVKDGQQVEVEPIKRPTLVDSTVKLAVAPTTTVEQDLHTEAQRAVDWKWESTQSFIAKVVIMGAVLYALASAFLPVKSEYAGIFFSSAFGTVIGFYFGRTNHLRGGGINTK